MDRPGRLDLKLKACSAPQRCGYCHGDIVEAFETCGRCGGAYHEECATRCVNLGCRAPLPGRKSRLARRAVAPRTLSENLVRARGGASEASRTFDVGVTTVIIVAALGLAFLFPPFGFLLLTEFVRHLLGQLVGGSGDAAPRPDVPGPPRHLRPRARAASWRVHAAMEAERERRVA